MDTQSQQILNTILKKEVYELSASDKEFLYARRSYLSEEDYEKFSDAFPKEEKKDDGEGSDTELAELQEYAKSIGIKSPHLYKDKEKLEQKIAEVESK